MATRRPSGQTTAKRIRTVGCGLALTLLGCQATPGVAPHVARLEGRVSLVARPGIEAAAGSGAYGDRRMRDARLVDYSRPGFAVVYLDRPAAAASPVTLEILDGRRGALLDPERAAVAQGSALRIANHSSSAQLVSDPSAGAVRRLAPGEAWEIPLTTPGPHAVHLLGDVPGRAVVFVAPGGFQVVSPSGRFSFDSLEPGPVRVRTWHPRFPGSERIAELRAGEALELDIGIGVAVVVGGSHADP